MPRFHRAARSVAVVVALALTFAVAAWIFQGDEVGPRGAPSSGESANGPSGAAPLASAPGAHASAPPAGSVAPVPPVSAPPRTPGRAQPASVRAPAVAAARAAARERPPAERRARSTRRAIAALRASELLRIEGPAASLGGAVHDTYRLHKGGLPVFNRTGRIHRREDGDVFAQTGRLGIPPLVLDPAPVTSAEAIEAAVAAVPGRGLRAPARSERGWLATAEGTVPVWQVTLAVSRPLGTWLVRVDARDASVISRDDLIRTDTGSGLVYTENVSTTPVPALAPLFELDGAGFLHGRVTQVFDVRETEAYRPDLVFDFDEADARFVQTSVYRGLTDAALFAEDHGLSPLGDEVPAFTNLFGGTGDEQFNNAFYDPFFPIFGFGNGDGSVTANLGTDSDVAIHEMGHHIFTTLVDPLGSTPLQSVAGINEGFADTLAAFVHDDPEIGESTIPGQPYLRTVENSATTFDGFSPDPHIQGLIYGGLNWDLRNALGHDLASDIVIHALPFLDPEDDFPEQGYREALIQAGHMVNGGASTSTIQALADARGLIARSELVYEGFIEEGIPVGERLQEGEFRLYLFSEFPGSTRITVQMTGTGDADLLVAPVTTFDPDDPDTYFFPGAFSSNETVTILPGTTPSVHDDDLWLIAVEDYIDGQSSVFQIDVETQLPPAAIETGGSYFGSITQGGDLRLITFEGNAGQIVRLEATALSEGLDVAVAIFDPYTIEVYGADDDSGEGSDALIQGALLPTQKTYGIAIFSIVADIDPTVGAGDFRLDLSNCPNTGPDFDGDGLADSCDDDDDDDTFIDSQDTEPLDAMLCQDIEGDGCDDCINGDFDPFDDGPNADGDHLCDAGDPDDDNDGCEDGVDPAPLTPSVDDDVDFVGEDCDNCPEDHNPGQEDFDEDGLGDVCDPTPMPEPGAGLLGGVVVGVLGVMRAAARRTRRAARGPGVHQ